MRDVDRECVINPRETEATKTRKEIIKKRKYRGNNRDRSRGHIGEDRIKEDERRRMSEEKEKGIGEVRQAKSSNCTTNAKGKRPSKLQNDR